MLSLNSTSGIATLRRAFSSSIHNDAHYSPIRTTTAASSSSSLPSSSSSASSSTNGNNHFDAMLLLDMSHSPHRRRQKLKPYIVKRRLDRCRTYVGSEKNIRHSPWRLNLICQLVTGLPLDDALLQLDFCEKRMAPLVKRVLERTSNLADIRHGLQPSQLEVAECFTTHGSHLKRMKIMGRGRSGVMHHRFSHLRVVLREIDFKLRIYQAPTLGKKKRWLRLQQKAQDDYNRVQQERQEVELLQQEEKQKQQA